MPTHSHAPRRMRLHYTHPAPAHRSAAEEALEAQSHAEGVQAFLTFATEVSTMSSPLKQPLDSLSPTHHPHVYQQQHQQNQQPQLLHGGIRLLDGSQHHHNPHHQLISVQTPHNYIIESTIYATGTGSGAANSSAAALDNSTATESPVSSAPQSPVSFHQAPAHQYLQRHPSYTTLAAMNSSISNGGSGNSNGGGVVQHVTGFGVTGAASTPAATVVSAPSRKPRSRGLRTKLKKKTAWRALC